MSKSPHIRPLSRLLTAGAAVLPLMLAACGTTSDEKAAFAAAHPCPRIAVLGGAEQVVVFDGRGTDITNVVARAEIQKSALTCEYDEDEKTISMDLGFNGLAELGPAATGSELHLRGFVAVTRGDDTVIRKTFVDVPVVFDKGSQKMHFVSTLEDNVLSYSDSVDGSTYEILVGFQLSPDQLAYNKAHGPLRLK
ncbi:MAG: hypothetical protein PW790_05105 [Parvibaculaceae bacterium]|nr:hypothetical protein [Parvibaculaceae bacterium]